MKRTKSVICTLECKRASADITINSLQAYCTCSNSTKWSKFVLLPTYPLLCREINWCNTTYSWILRGVGLRERNSHAYRNDAVGQHPFEYWSCHFTAPQCNGLLRGRAAPYWSRGHPCQVSMNGMSPSLVKEPNAICFAEWVWVLFYLLKIICLTICCRWTYTMSTT